MPDQFESLLGVGVYTIPEAARLTLVPAPSIRRWIAGYEYRREGVRRSSPPLWTRDIAPIEGAAALTFRDLLEVRFVQFFRIHAVSWKTIRRAAECAAEIVQDSHPFSTKRFMTDGRSIFAEILKEETGEKSLLDLAARQYEIPSFVEPFLFKGIEFEETGNAPVRWWPLGTDRRVVIDPARSFGQPICAPESVPTAVLARAFEAEGSMDSVARWFEVDPESVADAVAFEAQLRTAA
jgi:uncharacterized protein (DUF433 family)